MKNNHDTGQGRKNKPQGKPFSVPSGYFESFPGRLKERIDEEKGKKRPVIWLKARPLISLAAAISGFALISFTILQLIIGGRESVELYDISLLEDAGIIENELMLMEALELDAPGDSAEYTDWEVEAMNYLASNDVELELLLNEMN